MSELDITREELRDRMLGNISNDYDKTVGSFFYDSTDPVAIELETSYGTQKAVLKNGFAETAEGEYLDKKCAEIGIERKQATRAYGTVQITGAVGVTIAKNILIASDAVTFMTTESKIIGATGIESVQAECVQAGTIGNVPSSAIKFFPVTIPGLTKVNNENPFVGGYNEETDESLRERYLDKANKPITSGNTYHYMMWAKSVDGVGDAKVFPLWNGNGTVKVAICDINKRAADSKLVTDTASYIETVRPIGATITVESATEKAINITANIVLIHGRTIEQVQADFEKAVATSFKEIAFTGVYVSYAQIGSILYDIYGVADYSDLRVNDGVGNISLLETEIPVIGTVVLANVN